MHHATGRGDRRDGGQPVQDPLVGWRGGVLHPPGLRGDLLAESLRFVTQYAHHQRTVETQVIVLGDLATPSGPLL